MSGTCRRPGWATLLVVALGTTGRPSDPQPPETPDPAKVRERDQIAKTLLELFEAGKLPEATQAAGRIAALDAELHGPVSSKVVKALEVVTNCRPAPHRSSAGGQPEPS